MRKLTHTFSTLFLFPPSFFYVITRYSSGHYEQALRGEVCQNLSKTPYDADVCNFQGTYRLNIYIILSVAKYLH